MIVRALVVAALTSLALSACGEDAVRTARGSDAGGRGRQRCAGIPRAGATRAHRDGGNSDPVPGSDVGSHPAGNSALACGHDGCPDPKCRGLRYVWPPLTPPMHSSTRSLEDQRPAALLAFDSPLRPNWSNLPPGHDSLRATRRPHRRPRRRADRPDARRSCGLALSPDGYAKVVGIVGAEDALAASSSRQLSADNFWLAFFGEPSADRPLGLAVRRSPSGRERDGQWTGAHISRPRWWPFEPASYEVDGVTVTPLAAEVQAGLALMHALDDAQRAAARVQRPNELWAGAGKDGVIPPLEGSSVAGWSEVQQGVLLDAVALWVGLLPAASAHERLAEIAADLADTYFAWHGDVDAGRPIYYRIQGPALIIEFATQSRGGGDRAHYHSIYRDPTNEYGAAATRIAGQS